MTIPTLTYPELMKLRPCEESRKRVIGLLGGPEKWNGTPVSAQQARDAGCTLDDVVWAAFSVAITNKGAERRVRLWLADCAAHVIHVFEKQNASDARLREGIVAVRLYARGKMGAAAWAAARAAAWAAARAAAEAAAGAAAWAAARAAARAAAWAAAEAAAGAAAWAAARAAAGAAARDAEEQWQFDRLIAWLSDPEPEDWPLPAPIVEREVA